MQIRSFIALPLPEETAIKFFEVAETMEWLKNLQSSCVKAARKSGIELDRRRFVPHVTLARMNGRKRKTSGLPPLFFETQITVKEVVLYESILHPEGAEYHILEVFDLRKV